jgi:amino acid transporter
MAVLRSVLDALLGRPLASDEDKRQRIGPLRGIPMLGLDALASSAYGPEAALAILMPLGLAGLRYLGPILAAILLILALLYFSYRQTIAAYPNGGGSYAVARENLGSGFGLAAAAALILDYTLNAAVAISAGTAALVSAIPALAPFTLTLCLFILVVMTLVNLRGVRESGFAWSLPTYLFVFCMAAVLVTGVVKALNHHGHPAPAAPPAPPPPTLETAGLWLLARSFASGCTAMTGVEAVSNGVPNFAEPPVRGAQQTLTGIIVILSLLLAGIGYLCRAYGICAMPQEQPGYQSVVSQLVGAVVGRQWFYYLTMAGVLAVLALSANTSFAGFPRLCRLLAQDHYLPHGFGYRGRRLVFSMGMVSLALLAGLLLIVFRGITDRLIPLFAVGAFLAFTLSQAGMVAHWLRKPERHPLAIAINLVGAVATGVALVVIVVAKLREGAWITLVLLPLLVMLFLRVRLHYERVLEQIREPEPIDTSSLEPPVVLVTATEWNRVTEKALRFALRISPDVVVLNLAIEPEDTRLRSAWRDKVEERLRQAGLPVPRLDAVPSPYRDLLQPVCQHLRRLEREFPGRQIAIVIPEVVGRRWWHYLLHNQRSSILKAGLLTTPDRRLVVINVPWNLDPETP